MTFEHLWNQYKLHLQIKRRSKNTFAYYEVTRKAFERFREAHNIPDEVESITISTLRLFIHWLDGQGLQAGGVHAHVRAVKALFGWAYKEELLVRNPAQRLERPTLSKEKLPTIQPDTLQKLISAAKGLDQGLRDTAILLTLFDTGVRGSELVGIRMEDIQFDRGLVKIHGKGSKVRMVPIGMKALTAVVSYTRKARTPEHEGIKQVFLGRHNRPLTRDGVAQRIATLTDAAGLDRELVHPHAFRRGFAVQFLRNGGSVFELQQILGHASLEMTRRYVNFLDEDLKSAHLRYSPVDHM